MNSSNPIQATILFDDDHNGNAIFSHLCGKLYESLLLILSLLLCAQSQSFRQQKFIAVLQTAESKKEMKEAITMVPCLALVI